ncbi:MAG: hypothetical protein F6K19_34270 [Cyanothece sp. SIO1E1]|nr:hypothetical protein [Cyanothece sp. SIO1E1]
MAKNGSDSPLQASLTLSEPPQCLFFVALLPSPDIQAAVNQINSPDSFAEE